MQALAQYFTARTGCARLSRLAILTLMGFSIAIGAPAAPAASPGTQALARFFSQVDSFQARFTQIVLDENFNTTDQAHGIVWMQRPGRFRWDYAAPEAQQIVGDGARVWLYDIALEQVTVRDQAQALGHAPAVLLAGGGDLEQNYKVEDLGAQGRLHWVNLIPRQEDGGFTEVRIGFEDQYLRVMELLDTFAQRTRITFVDLQENAPIDDSLFEFVAPPGIDIIEQTEP